MFVIVYVLINYFQVFAKFLSFPYWPAVITSREGAGVNVQFSDGSTSGSGGAIAVEKLLSFTKENAVMILKTNKFKSGRNSRSEFNKACSSLGSLL